MILSQALQQQFSANIKGNAILSLVDDFENRVINDGGNFENKVCLIQYLNLIQ